MAVVKENVMAEKSDEKNDTEKRPLTNGQDGSNEVEEKESSHSRKPIWNDDIANMDNKTIDTEKKDEEKADGSDAKEPEVKDNIGGMETDEDAEEIEDEDDDEEIEEEEEKEEEEEEEEAEMSLEDKTAMVEAVRNNDYYMVQELWDKPHGDINMTWFNENLLMVAIRAGNEHMAEFLIDNGIDFNFECVLFDLKENQKDKDKQFANKKVDCYKRSCRQMAFDKGMDKIVEMIDLKNNDWFPFVKPMSREPRYRRPPAPPIPEKWLPLEEEEEEEEDEEDIEGNKNVTSNKGDLVIKTDDDADSGNLSPRDGDLSMLSDELRRGNSELYDEGYRTVSNSPYLTPPKEGRPFFITRPTKSSMLLYNHTSEFRKRRAQVSSAPEKRHLYAVGSYSQESRSWHLPKRKPSERSLFSPSSGTRVQSSVITYGSAPAVLKSDAYRQRKSSASQKRGQSALSQVSKILGESRLLSSQSELGLPYIRSTHNVSHKDMNSNKLSPWCHGNSTGVFKQLKDAKIHNDIIDPRFTIDSTLYDRNKNTKTRSER